MEIIFIGTGSGKTSIKRNHSSLLIRESDECLLIDSGDGISKSLMLNNIDFNSISSLIITHLHADHYAGIASLITQMKLINRKRLFRIFIHENFTDTIKSFLNSVYMFQENLGFDLEITGYEFDKPVDATDWISFSAKQNSHLKQKTGIEYYSQKLFVSASLLLNCSGRKIIYTSDVGCEDDLYLFDDEHAEIIISESAHVTFEEIFSAYKKFNPGKLFITHIPDELETELINKLDQLTVNDKEKIFLCYDGMSVIPA